MEGGGRGRVEGVGRGGRGEEVGEGERCGGEGEVWGGGRGKMWGGGGGRQQSERRISYDINVGRGNKKSSQKFSDTEESLIAQINLRRAIRYPSKYANKTSLIFLSKTTTPRQATDLVF